MMKSFRAMLPNKNAYEIADYIGKTTGIIDEYYKDKTIEGISKFENIQELLNGIKEYSMAEKQEYEEDEVRPENDLAAYLQQISLLTDQDDNNGDVTDRIKLMTVHAAKGLEFDSVYVVGMEEMLFPSALSVLSREDIEEERRLFYVAVTRARKYLTLSYALSRYKFGQLNYCEQSRFIDEIKQENIILYGQKQTTSPSQNSNFSKPEPIWYQSKIKEQAIASQQHSIPATLTKKSTADTKPNIEQAGSITTELKIGDKVYHDKFDTGKVIEIEGIGINKIATVFFNSHGNKKIMLKFAKLQILE